MRLTGDRLRLSRSAGAVNPIRLMVYLSVIFGGVLLLWLRSQGNVQPLFLPTPTATRSSQTYADEAEAHFSAGALDRAIEAYSNAVAVDPQNAEY